MAKALPESCLNCGNTVSTKMVYCPNCGQKNRKAKLPLSTFISDFLEDYFTVDSKFFRSIRKLIFSPGTLTLEFNLGRRKSYIAPFRLYIFISFVFFLLLALNHRVDGNSEKGSIIELNSDKESNSEAELPLDTLVNLNDSTQRISSSAKGKDFEFNLMGDSSNTWVETFFEERARRVNDNPEMFIQTVFKAASMAMFVMLPFFALLLQLFHFKKHKYYVEHLVHSVHFHSFLFIIFLFSLIANWIFDWNAYGLIILVAIIYLIISLRVSYSQSYLKSGVKAIFILALYMIIMIIGMLLVLVGAIVMS